MAKTVYKWTVPGKKINDLITGGGLDALFDMLRYEHCTFDGKTSDDRWIFSATTIPTYKRWESFGIAVTDYKG